MPTWTKEQNDAIYDSGKNIIVSAGAGSGKTAVLSERVLKKIEKGGSIDRLLILTFTKAAAHEMKERIRKKIKANKDLSQQLKKIDSSYITTFDSFSLSLVKKYHYLLNVKKNIDIVDDSLLKIKIKSFLDEVMEKEYQENKRDFAKLINDFCLKDDEELKKMILIVNDKLNMKYDKNDYLNNYFQNFYNNEYLQKKVNDLETLLKEKIIFINNYITKLSREVDLDYYHKLIEIMNPLLNSKEYDEITDNLFKISRLPNLPRGSSEEGKRIKSIISDNLKNLKNTCRILKKDDLLKTINETKTYVETIIRIIRQLDEKVFNYKFNNDLYDFTDVSKMAIQLVKENDNIRKEITESFDEILVDEYQDTSDLQEEFITSIANNNLYMVGDVKQSIYRFRNANPNIFREKYHLYAENIGGKKIDLLKNFRSREEVVNNINLIFNAIMSDLIGGANYLVDHEMVFGNTAYNEEGKTNQNNNLEIYNYEFDKKIGFKEAEIEAFIIAQDIKRRIKEHYQVFDKERKVLRNITYADFAILIDRSTDFELYKKIFLYHQIPLSIYQDECLTNSELFLVIKNLYKLIALIYEKKYNKEMEYAYLSIGRSFLFHYSDDELFEIVRTNSYDKTILFKKLTKIVEKIETKSIKMILDEIIEEFDVYEKLRTIKDITNNEVKIHYLYSLAENLNKMGYTFKDFDEYIEDILNNGMDIKYSANKEENSSVKIMTIHKSKGLEFHITYFPSLTKEFNTSDIKDKIVFDNELGIITPFYQDGLDTTFYYDLLKEKYYYENISEEIRLFYVALTRAKEKIIFVLPKKDDFYEEYDNNLVADNVRLNYQSFADILYSISSKLLSYMTNIDLNKLNLSKDYHLIKSQNIFDNMTLFKDKINLINYPKYSLKNIEEKHFSKSNLVVFTEEEKKKMELGSQVHAYLESLDLKNVNLNSSLLFKDTISKFLKAPLMQNIKKAKIYQEYEFMMEKDYNMVHGIIDLMLEYSDHIDIIDYKLKNVFDDAYISQLKGYKDYIKEISGKDVNTYLYSILDGEFKHV